MSNKNLTIGLVIVLVISIIGLFFPKVIGSLGATATVTTNNPSLGLNTLIVGVGCDQSYSTCNGATINGLGKLTEAGVLSTTTSLSITLQPSDLAYSTISLVPIVGNITITLPATTTSGMSSFLPNSGDRTTIDIINSTTTQVANVTLAGNTGTILTNASTTAVLRASFNNGVFANGIGHLELIRKPNTDIEIQLVNSI